MWFEKGINNPDCDFHDLQQIGVDTAQDNDILVEIGTFIGESLHCLINKKIKSGKNLNLFVVDNFDLIFMNQEDETNFGNGREVNLPFEKEKALVKHGHKGMLLEFYNNLRLANKEQHLTGCLVGKSWELAKCFTDKSVHFCFIDAGHSYNAVKLDLEAWYPKMKDNSCFCGHDWFSSPKGVRRAVVEFSQSHQMSIQIFQSGWKLSK